MSEAMPYLDCCKSPVLKTVQSLLSAEHDMASIRRCESCGCHWFYRLKECDDSLDKDYFGSEDKDDWLVWCVRLTPDEAAAFAKSGGLPEAAFFADRAGIVKDGDTTGPVRGLPDFLR